MISITLSNDTRMLVERMKRLAKSKRARERVMSAALFRYADEVRRALEVSGSRVEGVDYSDLRVVYLGLVNRAPEVAVIMPERRRGLTAEDEWRTVIDVQGLGGAGELGDEIDFVARKGPWPVEMLPDGIREWPVKLVSRRVDIQEVDERVSDMLADPEVVEALVRWEIVSPVASPSVRLEQIQKRVFPEGMEVYEDVAWLALRQEFGIRSESRPHLRRSLDVSRRTVSVLTDHLAQDLLDGGARSHTSEPLSSGHRRAIEAFMSYLEST